MKDDDVCTAKSYIEAPRWAGVRSLLAKVAHCAGVQIDITEERGWIRSTYLFTITGKSAQVYDAARTISASVDRHIRKLKE